MEFTYSAYRRLLQTLRDSGYRFCGFSDFDPHVKGQVILRHDIDFCLEYALPFAELESNMGISATYFLLTTTEFYNLNSRENSSRAIRLLDLGHQIGLHFDRTRYGDGFNRTCPEYRENVEYEIGLLEHIVGRQTDCLSMHQPDDFELMKPLELPGYTNAYSELFFTGAEYFSDSVMRWKRDIFLFLDSLRYNLQVLTHPFWYGETQGDVRSRLLDFMCSGSTDRYSVLKRVCPYFDDYFGEDLSF